MSASVLKPDITESGGAARNYEVLPKVSPTGEMQGDLLEVSM